MTLFTHPCTQHFRKYVSPDDAGEQLIENDGLAERTGIEGEKPGRKLRWCYRFLDCLHFLIRKVGEMIDSFIFFLNLSHHAVLTN